MPPSNATSATVYRYWRAGELDAAAVAQPAGYIKAVFTDASYSRAMAIGLNPQTATDAQVLQYADESFTYDNSTSDLEHIGDVASETVQGQGTDTFTYEPDNTSGVGINIWSTESVETLPDSSTITVFSNYAGEPILKSLQDHTTGNTYNTFYKYDSAGRLLWTAMPSAVSGYSTSYPDLVNDGGSPTYLNQTSGLIEGTDYYSTTTATQNGPATSTTDTSDADMSGQIFDAFGRSVASVDGNGYVDTTSYDPATGATSQSVVDASAPYSDTVLSDGPLTYWRLGESSGTTAFDAGGNGNNGTYSGTYSLSQTGAITADSNTAASFNGGAVTSSATFNDAQATIEA